MNYFESIRNVLRRLLPVFRPYRFYEGNVDRIDNGRLVGWVYDPRKPAKAISVDIYLGVEHLGRITADVFREDLLEAGKGNGRHGFAYEIPASLAPGSENQLRVCHAGTSIEISRPELLQDLRRRLSRQYVRGDGIEIGALHNPLWVPSEARVRYVDRMRVDELLAHYQELRMSRLTPVDVIDDGEKLNTFNDASLDFIIMNHMLEHCENPLGTVRQHMRKLKPGGILYCTVPDMRFFADADRSPTTFDHLVRDDREGPAVSREQHFQEWVIHWDKHIPPEKRGARVKELMHQHYSIHFHVWNEQTFRDFLARARAYLGDGFHVETAEFNYTEIITILRKK